MPYVMMPVPEEHVEEVMQFVLRAIARASIEPWDKESMAEVWEQVDEASRSLLAFVARSSLEGKDLPDIDAARQIQMTTRETAGIMHELNSFTREANRPGLLSARMVTERLPNGRKTEKRVLQMDLEVAELVAAAEQAELSSAPTPLDGGSA